MFEAPLAQNEETEVISSEPEERVKKIEDEDCNGQASELEENATDKELQEEEDPFVNHVLHLLNTFQPSEDQLKISSITAVTPIEDTELITISTKEELLELVDVLWNSEVIALQAYFENLTARKHIAILAISTNSADYLIDTRILRNDIALISEVFLNPNIVKVMFASYHIHTALKKYLNLVCVNVFEVCVACEKLGLPTGHFHFRLKKTYPFLKGIMRSRVLKRFPDLHLIQLNESDRERFRYTPHFLLYFYHECRNRLLEKGAHQLLRDVMMQCNEDSKVILLFDDPKEFLNLEKLKPAELMDQMHETMAREIRARHECELLIFQNGVKWLENTTKNLQQSPGDILQQDEFNNIISNIPLNLHDMKLVAPTFGSSEHATEFLEIIHEAKNQIESSTGTFKPNSWLFQSIGVQFLENCKKYISAGGNVPSQLCEKKKRKLNEEDLNCAVSQPKKHKKPTEVAPMKIPTAKEIQLESAATIKLKKDDNVKTTEEPSTIKETTKPKDNDNHQQIPEHIPKKHGMETQSEALNIHQSETISFPSPEPIMNSSQNEAVLLPQEQLEEMSESILGNVESQETRSISVQDTEESTSLNGSSEIGSQLKSRKLRRRLKYTALE